jgi:hypothetical protein
MFNQLTNRKVERSGDGCARTNEVFYFGDYKLMSAQWSLAQTKKSKGTTNSISIVTWLGNPECKSADDVRNHRNKVVTEFQDRNTWTANGPLGKVVGKVYFLPQILQCPDGNPDVMTKMNYVNL